MRTVFVFIFVIVAVSIYTAGCSRKAVRQNGDGKKGASETAVTEKGNGTGSEKSPDMTDDILRFTGDYRVTVTGFKGVLKLRYDRESGSFSGDIMFLGWGNNLPQPLKKLSIKDGKIYFERSVESVSEQKKYGSGRYFTQKYYGSFSADGSDIKGEFTDSGAIANWRARK